MKLPNFIRYFFERNQEGETFYFPSEHNGWSGPCSNLEFAENHPILTPAILFVAKLFSQADFKLENINTGKIIKSHPLLDLLASPNYFSTRMDFLESLLFMQIANGVAVVHVKKGIGLEDADSLYLLDYNKIKFPDGFKTRRYLRSKGETILDEEIEYIEGEDSYFIKLKELMFFYDMPNGVRSKNGFKVKSRIDGLRQTLINTNDSLLAKNIILKTNGKELITGKKEGFPLGDEEKREAQRLFNTNYGLGRNRSRGLVTKADITWKSMHIALRDLGLDESVKVDGNLIYTALHIPKDILSLEAKKTTYENGKQSMISYIQNEMQATVDAFCEVINKQLKYKNLRLVADYDKLPIMQYVKKEKYESEKLRAEALQAMLAIGIPEEFALEQLGFPKSLVLEEVEEQSESSSNSKSKTNVLRY